MSSDIGNNCVAWCVRLPSSCADATEAIGNAYPSFQSPRKYLSPGLFGPCGVLINVLERDHLELWNRLEYFQDVSAQPTKQIKNASPSRYVSNSCMPAL